MLLIAISAGVISGIVVAAFFFALDRNFSAAAATNGVWTAPVVKTFTFTDPNLTPSETWASGVRTPGSSLQGRKFTY